MINLNMNLEAIRDIKSGDHVTLDGHILLARGDYITEDRQEIIKHTLFFTVLGIKGTLDSAYEHAHIRHKDTQVALMSRFEMMELIRSGNYYIG